MKSLPWRYNSEYILFLPKVNMNSEKFTHPSMQQYCQRCCFKYNFRNIIATKYAAILPNMQRGCGCWTICQVFPPNSLLSLPSHPPKTSGLDVKYIFLTWTSKCCNSLKTAAPNQLNLGFFWQLTNPNPLQLASKLQISRQWFWLRLITINLW